MIDIIDIPRLITRVGWRRLLKVSVEGNNWSARMWTCQWSVVTSSVAIEPARLANSNALVSQCGMGVMHVLHACHS